MNDRTKAALIGGALAGILSGLPIVGNCCCLWAIGGGILAMFLYTKNTRAAMTPGDGAMLGAVAGGIAAAIYLIIALPINLLFGGAAIAAQMDQMARAGIEVPSALSGVALIIVGSLIGAVGVFLFTVVGGLIGAPLFGKGAGPAAPPPPPPPSYGGPGGV